MDKDTVYFVGALRKFGADLIIYIPRSVVRAKGLEPAEYVQVALTKLNAKEPFERHRGGEHGQSDE